MAQKRKKWKNIFLKMGVFPKFAGFIYDSKINTYRYTYWT